MSDISQTPKQHRQQITPDTEDVWNHFSKTIFAPGGPDVKIKQLIAVAVAHVTQCPYCIRVHAPVAKREGVSEAELMEAIWVATEMRSGGAVMHPHLALDAFKDESGSE